MNDILHEYLHIMSDPAHLLAEVSLMVLIDVLFLGLIWPLLRKRMHTVVDKRVRAEHAVLDAEHGIHHNAQGEVCTLPVCDDFGFELHPAPTSPAGTNQWPVLSGANQ